MTPAFVPGLELSRQFYAGAVRPVLEAEFPALPYSAALIGWGSEVLGFDSPRSTDHNWGPRLQVFLADDAADQAPAVTELLAARLPAEFRGYPTVFAASGAEREPPAQWITVAGLRGWLRAALGFDPANPISLADWLSVPAQVLAEVTGGAVFHDGIAGPGHAGLTGMRDALAWYPQDIWLYVLACQWQRIAEEEAFPGRCAEAGDELGSAVVAARLARDLMRLTLLIQRRYPPYSKWLGTAFARTAAGARLRPVLMAALTAANWPDRQRGLSTAYQAVASLHNSAGLTPALDTAVSSTYYDRPYQVLSAHRFAAALQHEMRDDRIRALPLTGAADQFADGTDALGRQSLLRAAVESVTGRG